MRNITINWGVPTQLLIAVEESEHKGKKPMLVNTCKLQQHCSTFHKMERQSLENNRRLTGAEKWQRMTMLNALAEKRLRIDISKRHPDISKHEIKMRVASHHIPADLMRKAYGWNPELTDDRYDKKNELEEQLRQAQMRDYERRKQQATTG